MTAFPPFRYKSFTVHLHLRHEDGNSPMWIAEVEDTEEIHLILARHDDPERIRYLVRDRIDGGMPGGGPGA